MPKGKCPKNYKDITGYKLGKLTVIRRIYPNGKGFRAMWLCKCDCGKEKIIRGDSIKSGMTKSCGCLVGEWIKTHPPTRKYRLGLSNMRVVVGIYRKNARIRELEYNLTEEQFFKLTQKDCYYCGAKPNNISNNKSCNGHYIYNGIDRVNNTKGYTIDNVVPCCHQCNWAKKNYTLQEYKNWIRKSYYKMFKGGE